MAQPQTPQSMYGSLGQGLPPELQQAFLQLEQQRNDRLAQLNQPEKHPILKNVALGLLLGPTAPFLANAAQQAGKAKTARNIELDAMDALKTLGYVTNATQGTREQAGLATTLAPLYEAQGLQAPSMVGAQALDALGGLGWAENLQAGGNFINQAAGQGANQGVDLLKQLGAVDKKVTPFGQRTPVLRVTPDGGKQALPQTQATQSNFPQLQQLPQQQTLDQQVYAPMTLDGNNTPLYSAPDTQGPPTFEAGASASLPSFMPTSLQQSIVGAMTNASNNRFSNLPKYAKTPFEQQALQALQQQRQAQAQNYQQQALLKNLQRQLLPSQVQADNSLKGAQAYASSAGARATLQNAKSLDSLREAKIEEINKLLPETLSRQQRNDAIRSLTPFRNAVAAAEQQLLGAGLLDKGTGRITPPSVGFFGKKPDPNQVQAYENYLKATEDLNNRLKVVKRKYMPPSLKQDRKTR